MKGILLDIEGTTTPISFVYDVLFPYVRTQLANFPMTDEIHDGLKAEHDRDSDALAWTGPVAYVNWLMDRDRKSTALKNLQGQIWQEGYRNGDLHGEVFPDVPPALEGWHEGGVDVRIFSSGSVLAQKLLFASTPAGDLARLLNGHFDTTTGPKNEASSYTIIAEAFARPACDVLFISDVAPELAAARTAGMQTILCLRPGNTPQPAGGYSIISDFSQIALDRFSQRG